MEVFAPLVGAPVFKTERGFEQSSQWVRFPYTSVPTSRQRARRLHNENHRSRFRLVASNLDTLEYLLGHEQESGGRDEIACAIDTHESLCRVPDHSLAWLAFVRRRQEAGAEGDTALRFRG